MPGTINKASPAYIASKASATKAMEDVSKNLEAIISQLINVTDSTLDEIAKDIETKSNEYAPKKTEDLVKSSYIASEKKGNEYTVEIGYTDPKAIYQHENYGTSYKKPTTPGTKPKFLQLAATEEESDIAKRVAEETGAILK